MADNPSNDPITRAFDAIQRAFNSYAPLTSLVKAGNRINLRVVNLVPRKEDQEDSDWPEVFLKISGMSGDIFEANSRHVRFTATYPLQISSGILTVELMARVWFEASRALYFVDTYGRLGIPDIVLRFSIHKISPAKLGNYLGTEQWWTVMGITVYFAMDKQTYAAIPPQTTNT